VWSTALDSTNTVRDLALYIQERRPVVGEDRIRELIDSTNGTDD
jgi:hypothetical protein